MESVLVERNVTELSLAVWLVDDFTSRQPIGDMKLALGEKQAIKNPSGYYLFLDLPPGDYELKAETQYYFDQEIAITLPLPGEPVANIVLKPDPGYPFSPGATLIRGMVEDAEDKPVAGATAKIVGKQVENKTTQKGEFVLYFKALREQDIIKVGKKRYVRADGGRKLKLQVTHPSYKTRTMLVEVEEGKTISVSLMLEKKGG